MVICGAPSVVIPEDIPPDEPALVHWYQLMFDEALGHDRLAEPAVVEVAAFLSKHANALLNRAREKRWPAELVGYAARTGHRPTRKANPDRWLDAASTWLAATDYELWSNHLVLMTDEPSSQLGGAAGTDWWVRPLVTLGDVVDEGRRQSNCLRLVTEADMQELGVRRYYFSGKVCGMRLTISVLHGPQFVQLEQVLRACNAQPNRTEMEVIGRWFKSAADQAGLMPTSA
jgi:hypothetical protein